MTNGSRCTIQGLPPTLDEELKVRCLPILGAGAADPKLWDSAVRTAAVILEARIRKIARIADSKCDGRALVNRAFGPEGALGSRIENESERQGYRDLYAGVVGVVRNPFAHRLIDPTPQDGGVYIIFVDFLLRELETIGG